MEAVGREAYMLRREYKSRSAVLADTRDVLRSAHFLLQHITEFDREKASGSRCVQSAVAYRRSPNENVRRQTVVVVAYGDAPYDGTNSIWSPAKVKFEGQFGFVLVEMEGPVATLTWWHRSGTNNYAQGGNLFSYSIAPVLRVVRTDNALRLTWIGPGLLQSASSVLGPWIDLTNAVSGYSITNLSENREFFRVRVP